MNAAAMASAYRDWSVSELAAAYDRQLEVVAEASHALAAAREALAVGLASPPMGGSSRTALPAKRPRQERIGSCAQRISWRQVRERLLAKADPGLMYCTAELRAMLGMKDASRTAFINRALAPLVQSGELEKYDADGFPWRPGTGTQNVRWVVPQFTRDGWAFFPPNRAKPQLALWAHDDDEEYLRDENDGDHDNGDAAEVDASGETREPGPVRPSPGRTNGRSRDWLALQAELVSSMKPEKPYATHDLAQMLGLHVTGQTLIKRVCAPLEASGTLRRVDDDGVRWMGGAGSEMRWMRISAGCGASLEGRWR